MPLRISATSKQRRGVRCCADPLPRRCSAIKSPPAVPAACLCTRPPWRRGRMLLVGRGGRVCARCMELAAALHTDSVREYCTRCARCAHVVRVRCMYWGDSVDLPTYSAVKCTCFQAIKDGAIAHTALCPLAVSPTSLSWLPAGVTYTQSNGDRMPATVIPASECGQ